MNRIVRVLVAAALMAGVVAATIATSLIPASTQRWILPAGLMLLLGGGGIVLFAVIGKLGPEVAKERDEATAGQARAARVSRERDTSPPDHPVTEPALDVTLPA